LCVLATLAALSIAQPAAGAAPDDAARPAAVRMTQVSNKRLRLDIGFAHWFPDQFRHGNDLTSPSFGLGCRPGVSWLELRMRYDRSRVKSLAEDRYAAAWDDRPIQFLTPVIALSRTLRVGGESITLSVGWGPVIVKVDGHGPAVGNSTAIVVEYLFGPPVFGARLGAFFDGRKQGYALQMPDRTRSTQVDYNVAVGFMVAFLD
jgi:hypothetical protein